MNLEQIYYTYILDVLDYIYIYTTKYNIVQYVNNVAVTVVVNKYMYILLIIYIYHVCVYFNAAVA